MLYQDVGGDENWHLWKQNVDGSEAQDLTPFPNVRAQNILTDKHHPEEVSCPLPWGSVVSAILFLSACADADVVRMVSG